MKYYLKIYGIQYINTFNTALFFQKDAKLRVDDDWWSETPDKYVNVVEINVDHEDTVLILQVRKQN